MKICNGCKRTLDANIGSLIKSTGRYRAKCKKCNIKYVKKYQALHKDKVKEYKKTSYIRNKEHYKEYYKNRWIDNKQELQAYKKAYSKTEQGRDAIRKYRNKFKESNPLFSMQQSIRNRVRVSLKLKNMSKKYSMDEYLGCTLSQLKYHLESLFQPGMTWDNYGLCGWHIDHIIPLASASSEEELYKLCHYTNLQPLWAKDNLSKSDKMPEQIIE